MKSLYRWSALGLAGLIGLVGGAVQATSYPKTIRMPIAPLVASPGERCPKTVTLGETSEYYEGGYRVKGWANLMPIAGNFTLSSQDEFSATWVANLKPEFSKCKASAGGRYNGDRGEPATHLRLRLTGGKVYLIVDMTGLQDANGYTPTITSKAVAPSGNPVWQWAGTD